MRNNEGFLLPTPCPMAIILYAFVLPSTKDCNPSVATLSELLLLIFWICVLKYSPDVLAQLTLNLQLD